MITLRPTVMKFINDIEVGDVFVDPFHSVPSSFGTTPAIAKITEVGEMETRFGKPNRIVKYEKYVPKEGEYATLKFIEESSIWAGSFKTKIPNTIEVVFEK